jgi:photosystem II stability/assembly factor-like uncharacterized protein/tetratricopeptide (TPR) repeat protein
MSNMINPYIAGAPVTESSMFFGREDVFRWIERSLTGKYVNNILVVHGQRRVGKTSVLKQLPSRLPERYIPVFFDLQGRTHTTLDRFLWWLAREITRVINHELNVSVSTPDEGQFAKDPECFESKFLTDIRSVLGDHILVLTFDEFDMLDVVGVKNSMAPQLIAYLRRLLSQDRLSFIFSIGSSGYKLENMRASYTDFFKSALYKKISFLGKEDTIKLITEPVQDLLTYDSKAVALIYEISSGHPYFTQLLCHELFSRCQKTDQKRIQETDVESVLYDVIERGTVNLKFMWDEANNLEKWVLALLAHARGKVDSRKLAALLREQRVNFSNTDLNTALLHLREKDVLTDDNRFVIQLMRIWLKKNRPLERVREELIEVNPIANRYIEIGQEYEHLGQYKEAIESFEQALIVDSDNTQALISIASVYLIQTEYRKAIGEYEKALAIDEEDIAARAGLCEALLALGDQAVSKGSDRDAVKTFEKVLAINADHTEARQRMADIQVQRAEQALTDGRDEDALNAFEEALKFIPDDEIIAARYGEVREKINAKLIATLLGKAEKARIAKNWDKEIAFLDDTLKLAPDDQKLMDRLTEAKDKKYTEQLDTIRSQASKASEAMLWDDAVAAWEEYLALESNDTEVQKKLLEVRQRSRESHLNSVKMEANELAKEEKWDQSLATWREYQSLKPEDREEALVEIKHVEQMRDTAMAYAEAEAALSVKDNKRAIKLLKEVVSIDPMYKDASSMLAKAVEWDRGRRPTWQRFFLWGGLGATLLIVLALVLSQMQFFPDWQSIINPQALQTTQTISTESASTLTQPASTTLSSGSTVTQTTSTTSTPTSDHLSWNRLTSGQFLTSDVITAIVVDPDNPDVQYVGTVNSGIYRSQNSGISWQPINNGLSGVNIRSLVVDPSNPGTLYAGILVAGVNKSTDGGESWQPINQGIELPGFEGTSIVLLDPQDNQHLYYTNGDVFHESFDGGESWSESRTSCPDIDIEMVIHPSNGDILFAADAEYDECDTGLYRSLNGGKTWTLTELSAPGFWDHSIAIDSQTGTYLLVSAWEQGLFASSDGGETWNQVLEDECQGVAISPEDGRVMYCANWDSIRKSTDGGQTWQTISQESFDAFRSITISPHDSDTILIGGTLMYQSMDGGISWTGTSNGLGAGFLELKIDPADSSIMYVEQGYPEIDIGTLHRSLDGGRSWEVVTHRGFGLAIDAAGNILYRVDDDEAGLIRSLDAGRTWDRLAFPETGLSNVVAHPQKPEIVYALGTKATEHRNYIYISYDNGLTWQKTDGLRHISHHLGLSFDHELGQVVYAVDHGGNIHRSSDAGQTWTACSDLGYWVTLSDTHSVIDPRNSARLFVATHGNGVALSENNCLSWNSSNSGLGNLSVNTLAINPLNPDTVFAGTDGGVYVSYDGGVTWEEINDGLLGSQIVYSIVIDPQDPDNVYASTPFGIFKLERK